MTDETATDYPSGRHPEWPEVSVNVSFYFDDADPCAECECGWHTHGDAAVDAFSAWWRHLWDSRTGGKT